MDILHTYSYLEDGTLIREEAEWGEHTPVTPGQTSEVKELVKTKYPQIGRAHV